MTEIQAGIMSKEANTYSVFGNYPPPPPRGYRNVLWKWD